MLESMLSLTLNELQWSQFEVKQTQRPMFGPIETGDGYVMVAIASEKTFQSLMTVIGHPEWVADPRFAKYADRRDNWADLMNGVEAWSRTVTTEQCLARLNDHGVPSSAYRTVSEALSDPQIAHRGALSEASDGGGKFTCRSACLMPTSPRESGWRPWANTRLRTLKRSVFRNGKSLASPADRHTAALTVTVLQHKACGFSSGSRLRPCRGVQFPPICWTVSNDPEMPDDVIWEEFTWLRQPARANQRQYSLLRHLAWPCLRALPTRRSRAAALPLASSSIFPVSIH
jgi:hypothetical protein